MREKFLILLFISFSLFAQEKKHVFSSKLIKAEYNTLNGLLNGKYVSYYPNGKKKAEGIYKNNLRAGKWNVWDSTGKIHAEHTFKTEKLERNAKGYFDYSVLKEEDVMMATRTWRGILRPENPPLFSDPAFFDTLYDLIQQDSLVIYRDEELTRPRTKEDVQNMVGSNYYIIDSYKEIEDWFFDKKTNAAIVRPFALYIVLAPRSADTGGKVELGWLNFAKCRELLVAQKINDKNNSLLKNADDVFWYRNFVGQIYKELNVRNEAFIAYAKTPEAQAYEAERAEISMVEMEHDGWLYGDKAFDPSRK